MNLSVEAGRGAAVVGANGAGKSTLIRLLAGLSAPSLGAALLFGEPARALRPALRRRVGLLSHQSMLYPNLTARENLEFYATLYGVEDARARRLSNGWSESRSAPPLASPPRRGCAGFRAGWSSGSRSRVRCLRGPTC